MAKPETGPFEHTLASEKGPPPPPPKGPIPQEAVRTEKELALQIYNSIIILFSNCITKVECLIKQYIP